MHQENREAYPFESDYFYLMDIDDNDYPQFKDRSHKKVTPPSRKESIDGIYRVDFEEGVLDQKTKTKKKKKSTTSNQTASKSTISEDEFISELSTIAKERLYEYTQTYKRNMSRIVPVIISEFDYLFDHLSRGALSEYDHQLNNTKESMLLPLSTIPRDISTLYVKWIEKDVKEKQTVMTSLLFSLIGDNGERKSSQLGIKLLLQLFIKADPESALAGIQMFSKKIRTFKTISERLSRDLLYIGTNLLDSSRPQLGVFFLVSLLNPILTSTDKDTVANFIHASVSNISPTAFESLSMDPDAIEGLARAIDLHQPPVYGGSYSKNRKAVHSHLLKLVPIQYENIEKSVPLFLEESKRSREYPEVYNVYIQTIANALHVGRSANVLKVNYPKYFFEVNDVLTILHSKSYSLTPSMISLVEIVLNTNEVAMSQLEKKKLKIIQEDLSVSQLERSNTVSRALLKRGSTKASANQPSGIAMIFMLILLGIVVYYTLVIAAQAQFWPKLRNSQTMQFIESLPITQRVYTSFNENETIHKGWEMFLDYANKGYDMATDYAGKGWKIALEYANKGYHLAIEYAGKGYVVVKEHPITQKACKTLQEYEMVNKVLQKINESQVIEKVTLAIKSFPIIVQQIWEMVTEHPMSEWTINFSEMMNLQKVNN